MIETQTSVKSESLLKMLLGEMIRKQATDMHISADSSPMLRIDGKLIMMQLRPFSEEMTKMLAYSLMTNAQRRKFERDLDLDFSFGVKGLSRFRCNVFHQRESIAISIKSIPYEIKTPQDLRIPPEVFQFGEVKNGLVLVTGPRGSGKSTTLSALIKRLNEERRSHILTVEDPIELVYNSMSGIVNQREVLKDTKAYEIALASVPRQDVDILFVSEANDAEKLLSTLKVADMGLLVFATMRSRDAVSAVMRFIDLNMPYYLINGALRMIISQRLLRRICPNCRRVVTPDDDLLRSIGIDPMKVKNYNFYRGSGCPKCNGTGYQGRIPVFESLKITPVIRTMIQAGTSVIELWREAVNEGMIPMRKVALRYMLEGETTLDQVASETISYQ